MVNLLDTLSYFPFTSKPFFYHFLAEAVPKPAATMAGTRGEVTQLTIFFFIYLLFLFNDPHFNKAMKPLFLECQDHVYAYWSLALHAWGDWGFLPNSVQISACFIPGAAEC